jgi:serine/threonine-protein kinase
MPLGARVWKLGKLVVLMAALGTTFLVSFTVSMRVALRASEVSVPALSGVTANDASARLAELGLTLQVDESPRPDDRVPAGRITRQEPLAGTRARRQRSVRVWLSSGPRAKAMPRLIGQPERTARIRLEQGRIELAAVSEVRSTDYPPDTVIAQTPEPEAAATRARLLVNRGEPAIAFVMVDAVGAAADDAASALRAQGLRVAVATVPTEDVEPGIVVKQSPPAGSPVTTTDVVSLEVSR